MGANYNDYLGSPGSDHKLDALQISNYPLDLHDLVDHWIFGFVSRG